MPHTRSTPRTGPTSGGFSWTARDGTRVRDSIQRTFRIWFENLAFPHSCTRRAPTLASDTHAIDESHPRVLFVPMPTFLLWPRLNADVPKIVGKVELYTGFINGTAHVYNCPVYK